MYSDEDMERAKNRVLYDAPFTDKEVEKMFPLSSLTFLFIMVCFLAYLVFTTP